MKNMFNKIKIWWFKNISYPLSNWFWYKSPVYIDLNFWKIINIYMKCRKVFERPVVVKTVLNSEQSLGSDYYYLNGSSYNRWLHIGCSELGWKYKYNDFRYESVPYFTIVWMNKTRWVWGLESPYFAEFRSTSDNTITYYRDNNLYWEAILSYVYKYKDVYKTYINNQWQRPIWDSELKKTTYHIQLTIFPFLKQRYKEIISKIVNTNNKEGES